MKNNFLNGKTILISGATGGIGKRVAQRYCDLNCNIFMVHKHDNSHTKEIVNEISSRTAKVWDITLDLTQPTGLKKLNDFLSKNHFTIDIIINCVGVFVPSLVTNVSEKDLSVTFLNNLYAPINLVKTSLPFFKLDRESRIVNVSSVAANSANIGQGVYAMSKSALITYTKCLAQELFRYKIPVNCVSPGFVETEMSVPYYKKFVNEIPFKRFASPEEIAEVVFFLTSEKVKYITAQNIIIDGGYSNKNI